jgi:hypothetical protein
MKKSILLFFAFLSFDSCIDRFEMNSPNATSQLVVDGFITDAPGPYTVKLSRTRNLIDFSPPPLVSAKAVTLFDNVGNAEKLFELTTGIFQTTAAGMRGVIGREYFVRIEMGDGKIYESSPEKISPAGKVDSVYYEYEKYQVEGVAKYRFRIFMDSHGEPEGDNLFLWKLRGTYKVITSPELHFYRSSELFIPDPRPCSGYIYNKTAKALEYIKPCECCTCWPSFVNQKPIVSDNQIVLNGSFKKVELGIIPVDFWPFWDKTMVQVEQWSISERARNYWKTIRDQKDGATSLFQPAIGKAISNIIQKNGKEVVQGFFSASAVSRKLFFLTEKNIPEGPGVIPEPPGLGPGPPLGSTFIVRESCLLAFKNSTIQQPPDWK